MKIPYVQLEIDGSIIIGVILIAFGSYGFFLRWQATHKPQTVAGVTNLAATTVTNSTDKPDETPVPDSTLYTVPADMPRRIMLPTIGSKGFIQKVGTDQFGAIAVPSNINLAGWYTASVKPGDKGLSIIDGHVSGRYTDAIFKKLSQLKKSDTFQIEYGDKSLRTFEVVDTKTVSVAEASGVLLSQSSDISNQLNLITCGGKFNSSTQEFDKRIIVSAKLIK